MYLQYNMWIIWSDYSYVNKRRRSCWKHSTNKSWRKRQFSYILQCKNRDIKSKSYYSSSTKWTKSATFLFLFLLLSLSFIWFPFPWSWGHFLSLLLPQNNRQQKFTKPLKIQIWLMIKAPKRDKTITEWMKKLWKKKKRRGMKRKSSQSL